MYSGMTKNSNFVKEVSSQFRKEDEIIVVSAYPLPRHEILYVIFKYSKLIHLLMLLLLQGCQLGKRSMMAATDLLAAVSISSFNC
jgi:hypothetical protein